MTKVDELLLKVRKKYSQVKAPGLAIVTQPDDRVIVDLRLYGGGGQVESRVLTFDTVEAALEALQVHQNLDIIIDDFT